MPRLTGEERNETGDLREQAPFAGLRSILRRITDARN
jgi:hypothetical protein